MHHLDDIYLTTHLLSVCISLMTQFLYYLEFYFIFFIAIFYDFKSTMQCSITQRIELQFWDYNINILNQVIDKIKLKTFKYKVKFII